MLEFYHDLGAIVYYGRLATLDVLLRNTVILKPQWLIDTFQKILTASEPQKHVSSFPFNVLDAFLSLCTDNTY